MVDKILKNLINAGIDLRKIKASIKGLPSYISGFIELKRQQTNGSDHFEFGPSLACLGDRSDQSGVAGGHYFHQDLLIAQRIFVNSPNRHIDIGSRVDGFVAHVASFREIEVVDIRAQGSTVRNIKFVQANLMEPPPIHLREAADSLSCLHAIEHFGLGRYGDPITYDGHRIGIANMHQILKPGGVMYISTPIGPRRIEYNAHRVFDVSYLLDIFIDHFDISRFSFVDDIGELHENIPLSEEGISNNFGCHYGCGIFELIKK